MGGYLHSKLFKFAHIAFKICPTVDYHHLQNF